LLRLSQNSAANEQLRTLELGAISTALAVIQQLRELISSKRITAAFRFCSRSKAKSRPRLG
jgi:hypothetical protein